MRILILIATLLTLSGCTALMVGGAAVGGYQLGKDERAPSMVASDSAITTKIKSKYAVDSVVSVFNVGVRTYEGRVTLSGTVGSYAAREMAEKLAIETDGVKAVDNQIKVEQS
jgi:hyperosmotically inducible protein